MAAEAWRNLLLIKVHDRGLGVLFHAIAEPGTLPGMSLITSS
jgi:hypothetical protein